MASSFDSPKVFISYSWKPIANKQKTIALAERLESEGVNVILDEWNLAEGQDKYQFMEQMVNDPEVKRVLIICNKEYSDKANSKKGGVGIESLIISDEVYSKVDQKKFIPVIFERDAEGKEYVPTFIKSRIYIDLSNDEIFEEEYEKLMRNLFDKPASKKPPRGNPPAYITQEDSTYLRTSHKVTTIHNALINEKKNYQVFIDDYYETFLQALVDFEIQTEDLQTTPNIDDVIVNRLAEMKTLRDDYIKFLEVMCTFSLQFDLDKFIAFFEKLLELITRQESLKYPGRTIGSYMSDHYKFFFYELFLYTSTIMIEKERYKELGTLLDTGFIVFSQKANKTESYNFIMFNHIGEGLNKLRNERLQLRRISVTADLIKQRADHPKYNFEKLKEVDALLYFIGIMLNEIKDNWYWHRWFPHTTAYHLYNVTILDKMISKRYFEKMKFIFNVTSVEELKAKIDKIIEIQADKLQRWDYEFPQINQVFNFEKIGTFS